MRISIITVAYNSASTIADTFASVEAQQYPDLEYIVVDGGSTDGTVDIILQYKRVITKFISEKDDGLYHAMNKGIAMATGDVIGVLNSDDFYAYPGVLNDVAIAFANGQPECLYGDLQYVAADNTNRVVRHWKAGKGSVFSFYCGWMPPHPTFFATRKAYETCGMFDTRFPVASDYELMLRFIVKHRLKITYLPKVMVKMRLGGESNKSLANRKKSYFENHEAWRINGLKPYFFTVWFKILRKLIQFRSLTK